MKFTIGTKLTDNKPLKLDAAILADTRALICSSSGGGKSRLLRLITEQVGESIQTIIFDPEGEFSTLRELLDILIVGENGDVQANVKSASLLARRLAETGVSAVLDIYDLAGKGDPWDKRRAFVAEFLNSLMNLPKSNNHPMLVIVDEAHQFAPESKGSESATASRSAINSLMSAGRKRGFGGILATQRISKIHKDSIADCRNIFIGGTTLDIDQERAGDMLGMSKKESVTLRDLQPGQFYCYGPALGSREIFEFISGEVKTTHPKAGQRSTIQVPKASTKIAAISEKLGDLPMEAEQEIANIDFLRKENNRLKGELVARHVQVQPQVEIKEVEVPVIKEEMIADIQEALEETRSRANQFEDLRAEINQAFGVPLETLKAAGKLMEMNLMDAKSINQRRTIPQPTPTVMRDFKTRMDVTRSNVEGISTPEQSILDAIAWFESVGNFKPWKNAVAALAGYAMSGTFTNYLGGLRTKRLIDYTAPKTVSLTVAGQMVANKPDKPLNPISMQEHVKEILSAPERRILEEVIQCYPADISKEELAQRSGYQLSGTFTNYLGSMKTKGFINYPRSKYVRAAQFLFLE